MSRRSPSATRGSVPCTPTAIGCVVQSTDTEVLGARWSPAERERGRVGQRRSRVQASFGRLSAGWATINACRPERRVAATEQESGREEKGEPQRRFPDHRPACVMVWRCLGARAPAEFVRNLKLVGTCMPPARPIILHATGTSLTRRWCVMAGAQWTGRGPESEPVRPPSTHARHVSLSAAGGYRVGCCTRRGHSQSPAADDGRRVAAGQGGPCYPTAGTRGREGGTPCGFVLRIGARGC